MRVYLRVAEGGSTMLRRSRVLLCVLVLAALLCLPASAGLLEYVAKPDAAYSWSKAGEQSVDGCRVIDLSMTSQVWQGITWKHTIQLFIPAAIRHPAVLLFITGGNPGKEDTEIATTLANLTGGAVAILFNIPNQPLFDNWAEDPAMAASTKQLPEGAFATVGKGLTEDALIAFTFVKYFETGDDTWPLLLPMTKSAVRAMDTIQAFARQEYGRSVNSFVVTGASKRGWTTWLTGAVEADGDRVKGIAPMVIDTLDIPAQMRHQIETWGAYSEQIDDYTKLGIQQKLTSPEGVALLKIVDPYSYRDRIRMPKLIINGSNDPYWVTDALSLYWNDLVGLKWVLYAPNSGHGLDDHVRVFNTLSAFFRAVVTDNSLPDMNWKYVEEDGKLKLTLGALPRPAAARLWTVHSPNLDFRPHRWEATPMDVDGDAFVGTVAKPHDDNIAVFGEAEFSVDNQSFTLSTQVRILPKS
jgi:PhoPQ-activated pathogenicity-related protein